MRLGITIAIFSVVMCSRSAAAVEGNPQPTVFVYNDAGVPEPVLEQAERIAETIYQKAGIAIQWEDCTLGSHSVGERCSHTERLATFSLRIVARSLNLPGEDFGVAFIGGDGLGNQADVFYSAIERLSVDSRVGAGRVLGHVIAHELGHLMLGLKSHSTGGIMEARWENAQLRQISQGTMRFDSRQSDLMKARLAGPYAPRDTEQTALGARLTTASSPPM